MKSKMRPSASLLLLLLFQVACHPRAISTGSAAGSDDRLNIAILKQKGSIVKDYEAKASQGGPSLELTTLSLADEAAPFNPKGQAESLSWPAFPWAHIIHNVGSGRSTSIHLSASAGLLSAAKISAESVFTYAVNHNRNLIIIKNANSNDPDKNKIFIKDEKGQPRFNVVDGLAFVAMCAYVAQAESTYRIVGSLELGFGAISDGIAFSNATETSQFSALFAIRSTDTVDSLKNLCEDIYAKRIKDAIEKDMQDFMIANAKIDNKNNNVIRLIVNAALYGPRAPRVEYDNHHWNSDKAIINSDGDGTVKVDGRLQHSTYGQRSDDVNYSCTIVNGAITQNISYTQRSLIRSYKDTAADLVSKICHDAGLEFQSDAGTF